MHGFGDQGLASLGITLSPGDLLLLKVSPSFVFLSLSWLWFHSINCFPLVWFMCAFSWFPLSVAFFLSTFPLFFSCIHLINKCLGRAWKCRTPRAARASRTHGSSRIWWSRWTSGRTCEWFDWHDFIHFYVTAICFIYKGPPGESGPAGPVGPLGPMGKDGLPGPKVCTLKTLWFYNDLIKSCKRYKITFFCHLTKKWVTLMWVKIRW